MPKDSLAAINIRTGIPQSDKARSDQVLNNAKGYVFGVNEMTRLDRFLMLGTDGGTYYVEEKPYTKDNADFIIQLAQSNMGLQMVKRIKEISTSGRASRQNSILFALAVATKFGDLYTRQAAWNALTSIARTGSHLFQFITYREQLGGWNRSMRWAVGQAWYNLKDADKLAYQMVKYRKRNDWTHKDLLRLAHPKPVDAEHNNLFAFATDKASADKLVTMPPVIHAFQNLQKATSVEEVLHTIGDDGLVSWEMIPDKFINEPRVWRALVNAGMPQTALMRQLSRMTRIGLLDPFDRNFMSKIENQLIDPVRIKKGRIHPVQILIAQKTYAAGHGERSTWVPAPSIVDALDKAFYVSYGAVEPTNKRIMLALDVSGSMNSWIPGRRNKALPISCREAAAAIALATKNIEPNSVIYGFSDGKTDLGSVWGGGGGYTGSRHDLSLLNISPEMRLNDVVEYTRKLSFGGTNLSLPMQYAMKNDLNIDAFVIYTDNETWFGNVHPYQALKRYRERINPKAKLVVVSMTATEFSIADPLDLGTMDVVGFDADVVSAIADFIRD